MVEELYFVMAILITGSLGYLFINLIKFFNLKLKETVTNNIAKKLSLNESEDRNFRIFSLYYENIMLEKMLLPAVVVISMSIVGYILNLFKLGTNSNLFTNVTSFKIIIIVAIYSIFVIVMYLESLNNQLNKIAKNINTYIKLIKS
ncbi:hypothetical protein SAMN02745120_0110 [Acetoanaerobium noterae]|uniref:Uncharacterized protein n=1 Tax=Acetoanaerobium noterae TaxID=745369 RepID=A0A1T5DRL8_9FIRM|nr:hypothetical protein [Acetoanaerobium noterae]SKB74146.1 hypothetical protein SAMN02745120_0110 [Acetoanaerobium noterae]